MRRLILLSCLVGCVADGPDETSSAGSDDEASQDAQDREECRDPAIAECPPGFGFQFHGGGDHEDLVVVDLATMGEPVCDGHGTFMPSESLEGVDLVGVHVTRNRYCTFGCFAGCPFTSACWSERADGGACVQACAVPSIDEQGCVEMVRDCLEDDGGAMVCEGQ
jgi:hypothetical protein